MLVPRIPLRDTVTEQAAVAREAVGELTKALELAEGANLRLLAYLIEMALREAQQLVGDDLPPDPHAQ